MKKFKIGDKVRFTKEAMALNEKLREKTGIYTICNITELMGIYKYELKEDEDANEETKFLFDLINQKVVKKYGYSAKMLELATDEKVTNANEALVDFGTVINTFYSTSCGVYYFSRGNSKLRITNSRIGNVDVLVTANGKLYNPSYEDIFAKDWHKVEAK